MGLRRVYTFLLISVSLMSGTDVSTMRKTATSCHLPLHMLSSWLKAKQRTEDTLSHQLSSSHTASQKKHLQLNLVIYFNIVFKIVSFQHAINTVKITELFYILFWGSVFKIRVHSVVKTLATFQMIKSHLWLVAPVMASRGPECPVNPLGPGDHLRSSSIFSVSTKYPLINPFLSVPPGTVGYSSPVLVKTLTKSYTKELKK